MENLLLVYLTYPTEKEAVAAAKLLLAKHLIACGNIHSSRSIYRWKGKLVDGEEFVLVAKTVAKNFNSLKKEAEKVHPYSLPCIIAIPAEGSKTYTAWVKRVARNQ